MCFGQAAAVALRSSALFATLPAAARIETGRRAAGSHRSARRAHGPGHLGHSKKDLIRNLLWVIVHSEDRARVRHRPGIQVMQKVK